MRRMVQGSVQWLGMVMADGMTSLIRGLDKAEVRVWYRTLDLVCLTIQKLKKKKRLFVIGSNSNGEAGGRRMRHKNARCIGSQISCNAEGDDNFSKILYMSELSPCT